MDDCINNLLTSILTSTINQQTLKKIQIVINQQKTQKQYCQFFNMIENTVLKDSTQNNICVDENIMKPFDENNSQNKYYNKIKPIKEDSNLHNQNILKPFNENIIADKKDKLVKPQKENLQEFYNLSNNFKDNTVKVNIYDSFIKNEMNDDYDKNVKNNDNENNHLEKGNNKTTEDNCAIDIDMKKNKENPESKKLFQDISTIINSFTINELYEILKKQNYVLPSERNFLLGHLNLIIEGKLKIFKYSDLVPNYLNILQLGKFILHANRKQIGKKEYVEPDYHKKELIYDILNHPNNEQILNEQPYNIKFNNEYYILLMIKLDPNKFDSLVEKLELNKSVFFRKMFNINNGDRVINNIKKSILDQHKDQQQAGKINNPFINLLLDEKKKKINNLKKEQEEKKTFNYSDILKINNDLLNDEKLKTKLKKLEKFDLPKEKLMRINEILMNE